MITLVKDKTYVRVSSWEEIFEMPGYTNILNPKQEKLKQIIGKYEFTTMEECGLSNCKTPHSKGYIVSTETGKLTNLGHHCGKRHFGVEFKSLSKQFNRDFRDYQARQRIEKCLREHGTYISRLNSIENDYGKVEDIYALQQFFTKPSKGCPDLILSELSKMVKKRDATIYSTQKLTDKEYETLKSSGQKKISRFKEVPVAMLNGFSFLFKENDLRKFATDFKNPLDNLGTIDVNSLTSSELDTWSKKIGDFDSTLNHTIEILQNGKKFCEPQNIRKFKHFMPNENKKWKQFLQTIKNKFSILV